jgi:hypothetical protein
LKEKRSRGFENPPPGLKSGAGTVRQKFEEKIQAAFPRREKPLVPRACRC